MIPPSYEELNTTFSALADSTRRAILKQLSEGEHTVSQVAEPFSMSLPAISKHIRVLEKAGLLTRRKEGVTHYLSLNAEPLQRASDWFGYYKKFWTQQLDQLEHFLLSQKEDTHDPNR